MAASSPPMSVYVAPSAPQTTTSLLTELQSVGSTLSSTQNMVPQVATSAPSSPQDGMLRYAKSPWRPVTGQTSDAWVHYDASTSTWKLLTSS